MNIGKANMLSALCAVLGFAVLGAGAASYYRGRDTKASMPEKTLDDYLNEGKKYFERGDYQEAAISYRNAVEMDGENPDALLGLGNAYVNSEAYEDAEVSFQSMIAMNREDAEAYLQLARTYFAEGKLEEARELLEEAREIVKDERIQELYNETIVPEPSFSLDSGDYEEYQLLELDNRGNGTYVYYTLTGKEPDKRDSLFVDGIVLSEPEITVKAKAYNGLGYSSETVTLQFHILKPVEEVPLGSREKQLVESLLQRRNGQPVYNYELARLREAYIVGTFWHLSQENLSRALFYNGNYEIQNYSSIVSSKGNIESLSFLRYCPFLKSLNIAYQDAINLEEISACQSLENLSLINTGITDISPLASLSGLKSLCLGWNRISEVSPLASLTSLHLLSLWGNEISDISSLSGLTGLTYFDISDNAVTDASVIGCFENLTELWIRGNQIRDVSFTDNLQKLGIFMGGENPIENYGKLRNRTYDMGTIDITA